MIQDVVVPERWRRGEPVSARKLDKLSDAVLRGRPVPTGPVQVPGRSVASPIVQARLVSVGNDTLQVVTWDGTTEGADEITVAKPFLLRRTPFDGETWNGVDYTYTSATERSGDDGTNTEDQVVIPPYVADDVVYIVRVFGGTDTVDGASAPVAWLDLNVDGRAWAKQAAP
jgi:hypothetical protein